MEYCQLPAKLPAYDMAAPAFEIAVYPERSLAFQIGVYQD
jgi:hypothetical protein